MEAEVRSGSAALPARDEPSDDLAGRYLSVRRATESLCAGLSAEDMMVQPMDDASPAKWHLAHTSWFFETFLLCEFLDDYMPVNPDFRFLFNSYYNAVGERPRRDMRGALSRPSLEEVWEYRRRIDEAMLRLLNVFRVEDSDFGGQDARAQEIAALAEVGLNHEQQHQELIVTDMKYALWMNPLRPAWKATSAVAPETGRSPHHDFRNDPRHNPRTATEITAVLTWHEFSGGVHEIGHFGPGFCFDNERPRHKVYVHDFALASRLVTNAEYLAFMGDAGYARPELWLSEGWEAVQTNGWRAPLYWEQRDGEWWHFTCSGTLPVDPAAPVCHISYFEAEAFARWAGCRLPTEAEWEVAASSAHWQANADARDFAATSIGGNFLESGAWHPMAPSHRNSQLFGDCWQWTQSSYAPYPGYRPAPGAVGEYNGKFMCNQYVLRGGSCVTPRSHIRSTYRNFFPTGARWQFSGVRLAKDLNAEALAK